MPLNGLRPWQQNIECRIQWQWQWQDRRQQAVGSWQFGYKQNADCCCRIQWQDSGQEAVGGWQSGEYRIQLQWQWQWQDRRQSAGGSRQEAVGGWQSGEYRIRMQNKVAVALLR